MITLVTGGTKCGKSAYAEKLIDRLSCPKYYIATSNPVGDEAQEIIARNMEMRIQKKYITLDCPRDIAYADIPVGSAVLVEYIGKLCANEMYVDGKILRAADKIVSGLQLIAAKASELVIVTNAVGSDGISYSPDLMEYIKEMGRIDRRLAEFSDNVIECVYGIPIALKGSVISTND